MTHDAAWHEARRLGIGGSAWRHVLGIEPYGCPRQLWYEKIGITPDYEREETGPMRRGTIMEPLCVSEVEAATGRRARRASRPPKTSLPEWWLGQNPDRILSPVEGDDGRGILECKVFGPQTFWKTKKDGIPDEIIAQVHTYMAFWKCSWSIVGILNPVSWELITRWVDIDDELIQKMVRVGEAFWRSVENGPTPDRIEPPDRRCQSCPWRLTCQGVAIFDPVEAGDDDVEEISDPTLEALAQELKDVQGVEGDAHTMASDLKQQIRHHLGKPRRVLSGSCRVYWSQSMSSRVDLDAMRKEHPGLVSKFTVPKVGTRLSVYV